MFKTCYNKRFYSLNRCSIKCFSLNHFPRLKYASIGRCFVVGFNSRIWAMDLRQVVPYCVSSRCNTTYCYLFVY